MKLLAGGKPGLFTPRFEISEAPEKSALSPAAGGASPMGDRTGAAR
jgi:hypothetical protein